jgi:hypothetical protein
MVSGGGILAAYPPRLVAGLHRSLVRAAVGGADASLSALLSRLRDASKPTSLDGSGTGAIGESFDTWCDEQIKPCLSCPKQSESSPLGIAGVFILTGRFAGPERPADLSHAVLPRARRRLRRRRRCR